MVDPETAMLDDAITRRPAALAAIERDATALRFDMSAEHRTGALLRTLAASKPGGAFLELGTGCGFSAAWLLDGMDSASRLLTIDSDERFVSVARRCLGSDPRAEFRVADAAAFLEHLRGRVFDLIFADTWPGKFDHLNKALTLLSPGGLYVIDDLLPQPNWPPDHAPKVSELIATLERDSRLLLCKLAWSSGIVIATRLPIA